jgi:hypothetical protein
VWHLSIRLPDGVKLDEEVVRRLVPGCLDVSIYDWKIDDDLMGTRRYVKIRTADGIASALVPRKGPLILNFYLLWSTQTQGDP